ncbi:hypothetical protein AAFF_G00404550 [Aldrovandia affinis]|uniref:Uncharacterized protein n=1 Tax=Aldrovandia affinis TaxID=143900 RepID=A0AAD7T7Z2_9TELE|nr:hypothetical protein AAFF_G00404550 [Aldrovandia affinis]
MTASLDPFQSPVQVFSFGAWQLLLGGSGLHTKRAEGLDFGTTRRSVESLYQPDPRNTRPWKIYNFGALISSPSGKCIEVLNVSGMLHYWLQSGAIKMYL